MSNRQLSLVILAVILAGAVFFGYTSAFYHQDANEICVVQSPVAGELTVSITPGMHYLGGGHVTRYPRRGQIDFDAKDSAPEGALHISPMKCRFNDGAEADISGSLAWEMPLDTANIIDLHKNYGSATAIEQQIIVKNISKAIFMTGPLMSSAESYASRRNDLLNLVFDQVENGAYKTVSKDVTTKDPLTGADKSVRVVDIVLDDHGVPIREDKSIISGSGLKTFNLTLDSIVYPPTVEQQIQNQQQSIMAVQTAIAKAKTAEQDAITIEQQGKATAAQAKWEQEAVRAKEVTIAQKNVDVATLTAQADMTNAVILAQKQLEVARLDALAAEQTKAAAILRGEGEAQAAQLKMNANGALDQKLAAYQAVNQAYAQAIADYKGNWVPSTVFGGNGGTTSGTAGGGASQLIDLLTAKTAKDLSLDLTMTGNTARPSTTSN